jgi:hypothetical protein
MGGGTMNFAAFTFEESTHTYRLDSGLVVPSTTQILKRCGLVSYEQVQRDVLENKRHLGEVVHIATSYLDDNDLDLESLPQQAHGYVEAWERFKRECNVHIVASESRSLGSFNDMPYGMTFDRLAVVNGREAVLELKCSAQKEKWWGLQLASYDIGLGSPESQLHRDRYAVHLKPYGKYRLEPFTDETEYDVFTWALAMTWWMLNNGYSLD